MPEIYIDGQAGTTGLEIVKRLSQRDDIHLILIDEDKRKDEAERRRCMNAADLVFLCLPDEAAIEAVKLIEDPRTKVIDASTAHRCDPQWAYGFSELGEHFLEDIRTNTRVANPGCHATGFISIVYPLIQCGILSPEETVTAYSLSGYSGGGKKMIAQYAAAAGALAAPRQYGLTQQHKHLKEMTAVTGLDRAPVFCPVVADFYSGMEVIVPLSVKDLKGGASAEDVKEVYRGLYDGKIVFFRENCDEEGFLSAGAYAGKDCMEISVHGNDERIVLVARYDNLGKGASGAAVECMNLVLGLPPETGLEL